MHAYIYAIRRRNRKDLRLAPILAPISFWSTQEKNSGKAGYPSKNLLNLIIWIKTLFLFTYIILKCRVYFFYISHLLNNSIIGFYIFTSFVFYIFTSLHLYIITSLHLYIFTSLHFHIFCIFELLYSSFFPSEFPSLVGGK